jgi:hypothetical protein
VRELQRYDDLKSSSRPDHPVEKRRHAGIRFRIVNNRNFRALPSARLLRRDHFHREAVRGLSARLLARRQSLWRLRGYDHKPEMALRPQQIKSKGVGTGLPKPTIGVDAPDPIRTPNT